MKSVLDYNKEVCLMEELLRCELGNYTAYASEIMLLELHNASYPDPLIRQRLDLLSAKHSLLSCLLGLLRDDELFVITHHLIDQQDWPRVAISYAREWGADYAKTERTLQKYQALAVGKMVAFAREHEEIIRRLFESDCLFEEPEDGG